MHTLIYDGSFEGWLCSVFQVYEYKWKEVHICTQEKFQEDMFGASQEVITELPKSDRVLKGLEKKISAESMKEIFQAFLSELPGVENILLQYARYIFDSSLAVETDFSHPAVVWVKATARKVWREKHRMEAFVRFQKTADDLYYSLIEPDYNVLPLIADHFKRRYADQCWLIYDGKRKSGIYYDKEDVQPVSLVFSELSNQGKDLKEIQDPEETIFQELWQQYFKSVNIEARKNTKLHIQHMPRRYWKYLTEKKPTQFRK